MQLKVIVTYRCGSQVRSWLLATDIVYTNSMIYILHIMHELKMDYPRYTNQKDPEEHVRKTKKSQRQS